MAESARRDGVPMKRKRVQAATESDPEVIALRALAKLDWVEIGALSNILSSIDGFKWYQSPFFFLCPI